MNEEQQVVGGTRSRRWLQRTRIWILASSGFIILVVVTLVYVLTRTDGEMTEQPVSEPGAVCSADELRGVRAAVRQESYTAQAIQAVAHDVMTRDAHRTDINCVYIALRYYLDISDTIGVQEYLEPFNALVAASLEPVSLPDSVGLLQRRAASLAGRDAANSMTNAPGSVEVLYE